MRVCWCRRAAPQKTPPGPELLLRIAGANPPPGTASRDTIANKELFSPIDAFGALGEHLDDQGTK